jgi:hypothetical protein
MSVRKGALAIENEDTGIPPYLTVLSSFSWREASFVLVLVLGLVLEE